MDAIDIIILAKYPQVSMHDILTERLVKHGAIK